MPGKAHCHGAAISIPVYVYVLRSLPVMKVFLTALIMPIAAVSIDTVFGRSTVLRLIAAAGLMLLSLFLFEGGA